MRVLYLGPRSAIYAYLGLITGIEVVEHRGPLERGSGDIPKFDWLIAYRYKHLVRADVLADYPNRAVNVHPSFLPYNRGMYPNAWSWYDGTLGGVTVHLMDAALDTGAIVAQRKLRYRETDDLTLANTYADLDSLCIALFIALWERMGSNRELVGSPQPPGGSYHSAADFERVIRPLLTNGWDTPVSVLVEAGKRAREKGE